MRDLRIERLWCMTCHVHVRRFGAFFLSVCGPVSPASTVRKKLNLISFASLVGLVVMVNLFHLHADESGNVFKLGERFYKDSLYNLALEQYRKYLGMKRTYENDPVAVYKSAFCHYTMGNAGAAAEGFEEFIRLFPGEKNIVEAMYMAGTLRQQLGDYAEAYDWFFSVWSRFSGSAHARLSLFAAGECAEKENNIVQAIELYAQYVDKFPKTVEAQQAALSLVRLHIERKEYAAAEAVLAKAEKQWPADKVFTVRLLYYNAVLFQRMQKNDAAGKQFAAMAQKDNAGFPEMEEAYKVYIDFLTIQRKFKEAQAMYEKLSGIYAATSKKITGSFLMAWADNARRAALFSDAIALYKKILHEYPVDVNTFLVQYRLAECYAGADDFPEAIAMLRVIELQDTTKDFSSKALLKTGDLYFAKELYPSAITAYRRYLQLPVQEEKDRIFFHIGTIYQEQYKRHDAALREFENLLKLYPASAYYQRALFAAAQCRETMGEYGNAARDYDYIAESGGDAVLMEESRDRAAYIRRFLIKDWETAFYRLTDIVEKEHTELSVIEKLLATAEIFKNYLKDYDRALHTYEKCDSVTSLPDSLKPILHLHKAHIYTNLFEKATFEKNRDMAERAKSNALALFARILEDYANSSFADEAAYRTLTLTKPAIEEYERFITRYPRSAYLDEVYLKTAQYYEKKNVRKATGAYSEIVARFPSSRYIPQALIGLARHYLELGESDSAAIIIDSFVARFPASMYDAEVLYMRGMLAGDNNDYQKAVVFFRQLLYQHPFSAFAERSRYELAHAELQIGKVYEALNNFRLYRQTCPEGQFIPQSRYGIAKSLLLLGNKEEAMALFLEISEEKYAENIIAETHYELARIAENDNRVYDALDHYKKVLSHKQFPDVMNVHKRMGSLFFHDRIYNDAAQSFEKALVWARSQQDSVDLLTRTITAYIMDGKGKRTEKMAAQFNKTYGNVYSDNIADIVYHEGTYLLVEKDYDKAIARFRHLAQKFDKSPRADDASYQIALATYYQNKRDQALQLFSRFTTDYPASEFVPLANFKIGMIFHDKNDFIQAADYFTRVIEDTMVDSETRFRAANNAAVAFQKTSSWLDAARLYSIVLGDYPDRVHASSGHLKIGFCLLQASKTEEAFEHFKKANVNAKKEDKPEILYWIATCYAQMGELTKAIAEFLKVPYLYAGVGVGKWGVTSEYEAARLYERLGDFTKAITLYRRIVQADGEHGRFGKQALSRIERLTTAAGENK